MSLGRLPCAERDSAALTRAAAGGAVALILGWRTLLSIASATIRCRGTAESAPARVVLGLSAARVSLEMFRLVDDGAEPKG
jgi:hypothetical protein